MGIQPDFDAARRERARGHAPIEFTLGGETFHTIAVVPAGPTFDLIEAPTLVTAAREFLRAILLDNDEQWEGEGDQRTLVAASSRVRFETMCYRPDDPIDGATIMDVVDWLGEQYAGRPFGPSSGSSPSSQGNGHASSGVTPESISAP